MNQGLRSMTGFGSAQVSGSDFQLSAELRSVNHRFLKLNCRLSDELGSALEAVEAKLRKGLSRGSVTLNMRIQQASGKDQYQLDQELLSKYLTQAQEVADRHQLDQVQVRDVIALDGVIQSASSQGKDAQDAHAAEITKCAEEVVGQALEQLIEMQKREGEFLAKELLGMIAEASRLCKGLESSLPQAVKDAQKRYHQRIQDFLTEAGMQVEPSDLMREIAIQAEKADVCEELDRMECHLKQYADVLESGSPVGRKLDFLTQEMFREANTMGSKLTDLKASQLIVDLKAIIDRVREQTQNIE